MVRSRNVMAGLLVSGLLLCAQSAVAQTRPLLSEVFQSRVVIQITTDTEFVEGEGEVTFNQPAGQALERYRFLGSPPIEVITRYDLGAIFTIAPPRCDIEEVTGPMPLFWGWISQAKQGDADEVNGIEGTTWVGTSTTPGPGQVLLATDEGTTPLYYQETTPGRTVRIIFLTYEETFKQKPSLFKPPRNCPK